MELIVLLKHRSSFVHTEEGGYNNVTCDVTAVEYEQLTIDSLDDSKSTLDMLLDFKANSSFAQTRIYLVMKGSSSSCADVHKKCPTDHRCFLFQKPYLNQSAMTVRANFSLHRAFIIFRTLGLRHLTVTSCDGRRVVGMITRRDLMGFNMEEKLNQVDPVSESVDPVGGPVDPVGRPVDPVGRSVDPVGGSVGNAGRNVDISAEAPAPLNGDSTSQPAPSSHHHKHSETSASDSLPW